MLEKSTTRADQTNLERLMLKNAKWEELAASLAKNGADKVREELRTIYGLTPGAATELVRLLSTAGTSFGAVRVV